MTGETAPKPPEQRPHGPPAAAKPRDRSVAVDAIRGFALLGILAPNLVSFAWPSVTYADPAAAFQDTPINTAGIFTLEILFRGKMQLLFGMLFGAGTLLFARKFEGGPLARGAGRWYRRMAILLGFGVLHGMLIWYGDILTAYALCGLLGLWWVRRLEALALAACAVGLFLLGFVIFLVFISAAAVHDDSTWSAEGLMLAYDAEVSAVVQGLGSAASLNASLFADMMKYYLFGQLFIIASTMFAGMAAYKLGLLGTGRSKAFYRRQAIIGITLGVLLNGSCFGALVAAGQATAAPETVTFFMFVATPLAVPLSLGYAGLVAWMAHAGAATTVVNALAAVGRTALSNYILQSILCTLIFGRLGFGPSLYARVEYPGLWIAMIAVWTVNITASLMWLERFRVGPLEWLWRRLTYGPERR